MQNDQRQHTHGQKRGQFLTNKFSAVYVFCTSLRKLVFFAVAKAAPTACTKLSDTTVARPRVKATIVIARSAPHNLNAVRIALVHFFQTSLVTLFVTDEQ